MTAKGSVLYIPKLSVQRGNKFGYYLAHCPDLCLTAAPEIGHSSVARHFSDAERKKIISEKRDRQHTSKTSNAPPPPFPLQASVLGKSLHNKMRGGGYNSTLPRASTGVPRLPASLLNNGRRAAPPPPTATARTPSSPTPQLCATEVDFAATGPPQRPQPNSLESSSVTSP